MTEQPLLITITDQIATIALNDPPMNPLGDAQIVALALSIDSLAIDNDVRVIVIRGTQLPNNDKVNFSVGANLKEGHLALEAGPAAFVQRRIALFNQIEACEKPVVAAIEGYCLGGGV